ncbi:hypothetical protein [Domibacillus enclensis]|uniref:Uncharacterized protein n=2 Tax=Domibacillus enclensis TaxID=1017273 RepID=A0A1N6WKD2_9BACI|nr:hypothetical protein [Domibacillus enclensis]SIQ90508.1 hypothetical protein SAMN05443094_104196 [Domibacillus enclensis]
MFSVNWRHLLLALMIGGSVGALSLLGTDIFSMIAIGLIIFTVSVLLYLKFRDMFVLTVTILVCFTPQISSIGVNIGSINVSVTDFVILFNVFYLFVTKKYLKIFSLYLKKPIIFNIFLSLTMLLGIYLMFSVYNDFGLALKLARTLLYSFFIFVLWIVYCKKEDTIRLVIFLSMATSTIVILTYIGIFISKGEYAIFRNAETFLAGAFCYLSIWLITAKDSKKTKMSAFIAMVLLVGAIVVQQDRVQIVAVVVSLLAAMLFLIIKRAFLFKRVFNLVFSFFAVFSFIYLLVKLINNQGVNKMFESYYTNRILILFNNNGNLQLDTSLSIRVSQYQRIIEQNSENILTLLFGKGLAATYFGSTVVVDSFWFWIILNLGLVGFIFFIGFFAFPTLKILQYPKANLSAPVFSYIVAAIIMSLTTPNMIYRVDDSVGVGIIFGMVYLLITTEFTENLEGNKVQKKKVKGIKLGKKRLIW